MKGKLARVGCKDLFGGAFTLSNVFSSIVRADFDKTKPTRV